MFGALRWCFMSWCFRNKTEVTLGNLNSIYPGNKITFISSKDFYIPSPATRKTSLSGRDFAALLSSMWFTKTWPSTQPKYVDELEQWQAFLTQKNLRRDCNCVIVSIIQIRQCLLSRLIVTLSNSAKSNIMLSAKNKGSQGVDIFALSLCHQGLDYCFLVWRGNCLVEGFLASQSLGMGMAWETKWQELCHSIHV